MAKDTITFHFQHPTFKLRRRNEVRSWLHAATRKEGREIAGIHYLFCTDEYMLENNQQFLSHDYLTDILTFPVASGRGIAGDILISVDRTRENARTHGCPPTDELHRVMAHRALHLLGYQDHTPEEKSTMRVREDQWLSQRITT